MLIDFAIFVECNFRKEKEKLKKPNEGVKKKEMLRIYINIF